MLGMTPANMFQSALPKKLYRDCFVFLEAFGRSKGRRDAAVDVLAIPSENEAYRAWQRHKCPRNAESVLKILGELRWMLKVLRTV